ncbi:YgcG family protein [Aliiroseovarius sp.]|uniref:TPM domain-containing protein n=1 Tax=Aliiroseovarius sp. TaxID=1872442 RepID=UPI0026166D24|nr:TPM domain-containing protein [Aliiroseovarius sp.]
MFRILAVLVLLLPDLAAAQSYPSYDNPYVNDRAEVLDTATELTLRARLTELREATGVDMTVLTLDTRETWVPGSRLEDFATGLFNDWGIGNANRNDGILILILTRDRDMRIELGEGYGRDYNIAAEYIIGLDMLPHFKQGDYATGILNGTDRVIEWIVQPFAEGREPPAEALSGPQADNVNVGLFVAIAGAVLALFLFGQRILDRFRRCPSCGLRGMRTQKETVQPASTLHPGQGRKTVTCRHCDHETVTTYLISRLSSSSSRSGGGGGTSGGFGGGRSSGGGASGRW